MPNRLTDRNIVPDAFDDAPATERIAAETDFLRTLARSSPDDGAYMSHAWEEKFYCEPCQARMNRELVVSDVIGEKLGSPTRLTRGYCLHCQRLYEVIFVLQGGVWRPLDDGRVVSDPKLIRQHFNRVKTRMRQFGFGGISAA